MRSHDNESVALEVDPSPGGIHNTRQVLENHRITSPTLHHIV